MSPSRPGVSYRASDAVRVAATEDGALLVDLTTNLYYSLNHTGYRAWTVLSGGGTREDAARALGEAWAIPRDQADGEVAGFIDELVAQALLVPFNPMSPTPESGGDS